MFFRYLSKWDITGFTVFKIDDYTLGNVENSLLWEEKKKKQKKTLLSCSSLEVFFWRKKNVISDSNECLPKHSIIIKQVWLLSFINTPSLWLIRLYDWLIDGKS